MKKLIALTFVMFTTTSFALDMGSYLIQNDIGEFRYRPKRTHEIYGNSGFLIPTGHFDFDHNDTTYEATYIHPVTILGIEVQVTQHVSSDSDKWLQHEADKSFRTSLGIPGEEYEMRVIDGKTIMAFGSAGWTYRWLSGSKVIQLEYHDSQMTKPEPLEIVKAYLAKHPSTLGVITSADLRTSNNKTKWIKDEMDRRLWLCDKWFMQLQLKKVDEKQVYQESVKSMNVFLDYREKYFRTKSADDKNLLASYLSSNNGTGIKAKLAEYKAWWAAHKADSINIQ